MFSFECEKRKTTMKKRISLLFTGIALSIAAQKEYSTATFDDGTKVSYALISGEAMDIPKLSIWLFDLNSRSTFSAALSAQYTMPERFMSKLQVGFGKISIENTYFFKKMDKKKNYPITIKSESNGTVETKYKINTTLNTARQLGIRFGYLNGDYRNDVYNGVSARANELSLGFSIVNTKYYKMQIKDKKKPYGKMGRTSYYVEYINYHAIKDITVADEFGNIDNLNVPTKPVSGYRVGLDGQVGGRFGLSYQLGFEKPLRKDNAFDVFFGFGLFLNFL